MGKASKAGREAQTGKRSRATAPGSGAPPQAAAGAPGRAPDRPRIGDLAGTFADDLRESADAALLSPVRTVVLTGALTVVIALIIIVIVTAVGMLGSHLVDAGVISYERLTSVSSVIGLIIIGSIIIAWWICVFVNYSFVSPLRRMTAAMGELARGNFDFRIKNTARLSVREVNEFAASFNTAARELGSTEMMRAGFISDFSHEFRTPINALSGFAQLLRDDPDMPADERREYLDIIVEESQRLAGLSERILTLSKVEAMSILPDVESVDVAETVRRAAALEEARAEAKGVTVKLALDPCTAPGNEDFLVQLWVNLLNNAVKFSPEGGRVDVALYGGRQGEEDRAKGARTADGARDELVCWVSDEGCGMDAETRAHLFDRFYQGDTSHAGEGSGLGLALCRRIAELHGGTISVESTPEKGSVFEVRLPLG